jgi:hypothetical protein
MSTKPLALPNTQLYEQDFAAWATETARLLREGRFREVDIENVAEEIESMAGNQRRELLSRLTVLVHHLLKWTHQPEKRSGSWRSTIATQRAELLRLLKQSPSLRPAVPDAVREVYPDAVEEASAETGLADEAFPQRCPFSASQILDRKFLPE